MISRTIHYTIVHIHNEVSSAKLSHYHYALCIHTLTITVIIRAY